MSDEILAALIGALGSIIGSLISAWATIASQEKKGSKPSFSLVALSVLLGAGVGFYLGFIPALLLISLLSGYPQLSPTPERTPVLTAPTLVFSPPTSLSISTPTPSLMPTFTITSTPTDIMNLVVNGSFTDGFTGWEWGITDEGYSEKKIIPFPQGRHNKTLQLYHSGPGNVYVWQIVEISDLYLDFYITFRSRIAKSWWPFHSGLTSISLVYLDEQENALGYTHLINSVKIFDNTNTKKFIPAKNEQLYIDYHINIYSHLTQELLGVDLQSIKKISILLLAGTTGSASSLAKLDAELIVTDIRLYPQNETR